MIWDAVRYGWNTHLWLTIAGVPVVWGESASGKTLPADFPTEDGSLSIDASAEIGTEKIDRQRGIAAGLGLSFKLLDTAATRDWLRSPSKTMTLTADQPASGAGSTDATVDDSTGWSNGDSMFLGMEAQTIGAVASGTSLTGITRAEAGTLVYDHATGSTAQTITDRPRVWRGRDVILYASPIDPSGYITGATLAEDAVEVWKGRLSGSPRRERDGFAFEAVAFDRVLDQPLIGEVSGKVEAAIGKLEVKTGWKFSVSIDAVDSAGASLWSGGYALIGFPFKGDTDGDMLAPAEIRDRIVAEFAAAVTTASAGAEVGGLVFGGSGDWPTTARIEIVLDANIYRVDVSILTDFAQVPIENSHEFKGGMGGAVNAFVKTAWDGITPWALDIGKPKVFDANATTTLSLTIKLDEGAPSDVSAPGVAKVGEDLWTFSVAATSNAKLYLGGMQPLVPSKGVLAGNNAVGQSVSILFEDSGTPALTMLRTILSSGNGQRSATYDTLERGQGYGLAEADVKLDSFIKGGEPITSLPIKISHADQSFADLFGGLLGMSRRAVVARPDLSDDHAIKLTLVRTSPYGSTYAATITDDDLLSAEGDPIESVESASVPNSITVRRQLPGEDDKAADRFVFNDLATADVIGKVEATFAIPTESRDTVRDLAEDVIPSRLASDQMLQAVELRVGPWVAAYPGDIVKISVTHPALWTWNSSPGAVGYSGSALTVGRRMSPTSSAVILTVLIDGQLSVRSLSPAMLVSAHTGTAANPATLDVPLGLNDGYIVHLEQALDDAGGPIELYHYVPGDAEGAAESYTVSAVTDTGSVCRLTIDTTTGGHSITDGESTLTLPTTDGGDLSTYQAAFAHVDDGSNWG